MATIDSRKLLPPSKESSAIEKPMFLVPAKSISAKEITGPDLKPVDKTGTDEPGSLVVVKKKVVSLSKIINNNLLLDQREASTKRKEEEKSKRERKEKDLEKKVKKNNIKPDLIGSIPGQSILDKINRFIGFTLLGYLFNQYGELLPKLMEFGKVLEPVGKFVEGFAKNILKGVVDFVEFGYKAYDQTRDFVKQVGGEGAEKTFDDFSKNLNLLLNGAIGAAMLIASTEPKKSNNLSSKGGGYGVGYAAGYAAGLASGKGIRPGAGFRDPGRYRAPGQARAGGFDLEQARKSNTFASSGQKGPLSGISRGFRGAAAQLETGTLFKRGAGIQKALYNAPGKIKGVMPKGVGKVFGRVPIVGGLIDFAFSLAMGENPGRAAAKAVGATVGSALGTFIPVPFAGTILGGILGDIVGGAMYDTLVGSRPEPVKAKAGGGTVTRGGQSTAAPSRKLKTGPKKTAPKIQPQKTQPGKDVGGKLKLEELYGKEEPGKRSALRALRKSAEDVKKMTSLNGLAGSMFGAGIDMALGQKPDKKLAKSIGDVFGSVVQNAVNAELSSSFGDISKTIAMANGGVVPTREIGSGLSIGERIGKFISNALAISIENSASKILQNLNREMNLEGGPPGSMPDTGPGGGPLTQSQQEAFEKIRKIAEKVGSPKPEVTAAIAMIETGWLSNPNSVYFASGKTNPFGQTGRGPKGSVIGKDGQEHAVYNSLEEGVKSHVDRWKSSYIGKTPQEIIESIRTGRGAGAPGMYNTSPSWTSKVLSALQSGTQPQPSGKPTKGAFASVLPRGNPQFASGFGSRWGRQHKGIDIGVDANSPVTALQNGEVTDIYKDFGGHGDGVVVTHSDGTKIVYGHVNSKVRKGEKIKKGQIVATVKGWYNAYGNKDNTHLHLERYVGGAATDPTGYLNSLVPQSPPQQPPSRVSASPGTTFSSNGVNFFKGTDGKYYKMGRGKPVEIDKSTYDSNKRSTQVSLAPSQSSTVATLNSGILNENTGMVILEIKETQYQAIIA